ncbi:MAG: RluA family pseudouridine synthase [Pirellulaceae bacterium]|nr:RluA family pseudouridine synthase [Pirellulaceae bacterium]
MKSLPILYEDNHLLVVNKPCGLATMGVIDGQPSVVGLAREYLKRKYNKPGNVYIGVVSRLDAFASGVLVLARTSKAAGRLSDQIRRQATGKWYLAVVEGQVQPSQQYQSLQHYVYKDETAHRMRAQYSPAGQAQLAQLRYRCLLSDSRASSILQVELLTGRKHQIRVQLSAMGHPIAGDKKYGGQSPWGSGIALHCWKNSIQHPTTCQPLSFSVLPSHWQRSLGADAYNRMIQQLEIHGSWSGDQS